SAQAAIVTFIGSDTGANAPGANSTAAAAAFGTAAGATTLINFETPLPAGVSIVGGSIINVPMDVPPSLYGGNTTAGGAYFLDLPAVTSVFTFTTPISAFGAYFGGIQLGGGDSHISFTDSTGAHSISIPNPQTGGF